MAEFICRLGTSTGEVLTRIVEATAAGEAKTRLESEGYRVFKVSSAEKGLSAMMPFGGAGKKIALNKAIFCFLINSFPPFCEPGSRFCNQSAY
ncbi:MAG: hypothetical protein WKF71_07895 [Pyrinomonadaceae bacterium]